MRCLNVSSYRFVELEDLPALRERLKAEAEAGGLRGTVLLASEGINLFLAGPTEAVHAWLAGLRKDSRFADLDAKESWSDAQPFKKLKVKIKREIIRMNRPAVQPQQGRAPSVAPVTLARWLAQGHDDEGREVVMLDTRNAFEIEFGAFERAIDWKLRKFSDFPAALEAHASELAGKTVVSYCTGGIRCEKAALLMLEAGLPSSYQLEGGILRYFEQTEGAPGYRGSCFVFDERESLEPGLLPAQGGTLASA